MPPATPPLLERIVRDLSGAPRPRTTVQLARVHLGLTDIDPERAEQVLGALLARDPRFTRTSEGWTLGAEETGEGLSPRLQDAALIVFAPRAAPVVATTPTAPPGQPVFSVATGGQAEVCRAEERLGGSLPRPIVDLARVCRRLRGHRGGASPLLLAESLGVRHVEAETPDAFAEIAAALWRQLAGELELEGVDRLDDLERMLTLRTQPTDFRGKSFGPDDLAALDAGPGVYLFQDADRRSLYVGQSGCLLARVASYFAGPPRDEKDRVLRREAVHLVTRGVDSAPDALLWEARWIRRYRPRLNKRREAHRATVEDGLLLVRGAAERERLVFFVVRDGGLRLRISTAPGPRRSRAAVEGAVAALFARGGARGGARGADLQAGALLSLWRRLHPDATFLRPAIDGGPPDIARRALHWAGAPHAARRPMC